MATMTVANHGGGTTHVCDLALVIKCQYSLTDDGAVGGRSLGRKSIRDLGIY